MEKWKTIKDYPDYSVSNYGKVMRINPGAYNTFAGKNLKANIGIKGYPRVGLYKNKKMTMIYIHKLVLEAFLGKRPKNLECNHIDGNKTNNNITNLEWVTSSENGKHAVKIGLQKVYRGIDSVSAKLTENNVLNIRNMYSSGSFTQKRLSNIFNVSRQQIGRITRRQEWQHI